MKKLGRTLALVILTIAIGGCASPPRLAENQTRLVIYSNPAGAVIRYKGKSGNIESRSSPAPIIWSLDKGTYISTAFVSATWASGAATTTRLNLYAGQDSTVLMQRPDVPGLERDTQYAATTANSAADTSADGAIFLLNAATVTMDAYSKSKQSTTRKTANCTSTKVLSDTVATNCTESSW